MAQTQKAALIIGGGRGMGAAVARTLHAEGWNLTLVAPSESCETLAAELSGTQAGTQAETQAEVQAVRGSAGEAQDLERAVKSAHDKFGRLDGVLLHTAGPPKGELLELSDDDWLTGHQLVVLSFVRLARLTVPLLAQQGGAFVTIGAYGAAEPSLVFPISSATRAQVSALTRLYSDRFGKDGIRFNTIHPGFINSLEFKGNPAEGSALGRIGRVEEIAATAAFLLSQGAGYITGQNLLVDGGQTHGV